MFYFASNSSPFIGHVYATMDGGSSWACIDEYYTYGCSDVVADPLNQGTLWTIGRTTGTSSCVISKTTDSGQTWERWGPWGGIGTGTVILVDPLRSDTVYAFTCKSTDPAIVRTFNGGSNWSILPVPDLQKAAYGAALDPTQPGVLYAGCDNPDLAVVAKSVDAGVTWAGIAYDFNVTYALELDPVNPQTLYAGANSYGVWVTQDGGQTWFEMNDGLGPDTYIRTLAIAPGQYVFSGGTDDGCFRWQLPLGAEEPGPSVPQMMSLSAFPNPCAGSCAVQFELDAQANIRLDVFDLTGRRALEIIEGPYQAGSHTLQLDAGADEEPLPAGVYLLRLTTDSGTAVSTKVVVLD